MSILSTPLPSPPPMQDEMLAHCRVTSGMHFDVFCWQFTGAHFWDQFFHPFVITHIVYNYYFISLFVYRFAMMSVVTKQKKHASHTKPVSCLTFSMHDQIR